MNCQEVKTNMLAYLEGMLASDLTGRVRDHIESCPSCKAFHVFMQGIEHNIQEEKDLRVNPFLYTRIRERINSNRELAAHELQPSLLRRPAYYLVIVVFAVSLGLFAGKQLGNMLSKPSAAVPMVSASEQLKQEFYLQNLEKDDISQLMNN